MRIIEEHSSLDGLLRLVVVRQDGDTSVGFEGMTWHTHGDILAEVAGVDEESAIRQFVDQILRDEAVIAVSRIDEVVQDAWPTDDPLKEMKYKPPEEEIEFRYWSGRKLSFPLNGEN